MYILAFSVIFITAILILVATSAKAYIIESDVVINKGKEEVFNYAIQLKNQIHYNKWMMADLNKTLTYKGMDGTVGFITS